LCWALLLAVASLAEVLIFEIPEESSMNYMFEENKINFLIIKWGKS
jgi:hypothetical protein